MWTAALCGSPHEKIKSVLTDDPGHFEETPYGMLAFEIIVKMTVVEKAPVHSGVQTCKHVDVAVPDHQRTVAVKRKMPAKIIQGIRRRL